MSSTNSGQLVLCDPRDTIRQPEKEELLRRFPSFGSHLKLWANCTSLVRTETPLYKLRVLLREQLEEEKRPHGLSHVPRTPRTFTEPAPQDDPNFDILEVDEFVPVQYWLSRPELPVNYCRDWKEHLKRKGRTGPFYHRSQIAMDPFVPDPVDVFKDGWPFGGSRYDDVWFLFHWHIPFIYEAQHPFVWQLPDSYWTRTLDTVPRWGPVRYKQYIAELHAKAIKTAEDYLTKHSGNWMKENAAKHHQNCRLVALFHEAGELFEQGVLAIISALDDEATMSSGNSINSEVFQAVYPQLQLAKGRWKGKLTVAGL